MADDDTMADRFRAMLGPLDAITEKRMMGGLCFFLDGNMLGGVRREKAAPGGMAGLGHFMFRVGKVAEAAALQQAETRPVELGKRRMGGFVYIAEEAPDRALTALMAMAVDFVGTLPAK